MWKSPGSHGFQIPIWAAVLIDPRLKLQSSNARVLISRPAQGRWTVGFAIRFIDTTPYAFYSSQVTRISSAVR